MTNNVTRGDRNHGRGRIRRVIHVPPATFQGNQSTGQSYKRPDLRPGRANSSVGKNSPVLSPGLKWDFYPLSVLNQFTSASALEHLGARPSKEKKRCVGSQPTKGSHNKFWCQRRQEVTRLVSGRYQPRGEITVRTRGEEAKYTAEVKRQRHDWHGHFRGEPHERAVFGGPEITVVPDPRPS